LIVVGMAEGVLILGVLWRRTGNQKELKVDIHDK
jgi:hypothetical protein